MARTVVPYPIRFSEEDVEMVDYLKGRLALETPSQVIRHAVRRLFQAEKKAEKLEAK